MAALLLLLLATNLAANVSLTTTAEKTQQLSGLGAASSEQTSVNVQGVAAASAELASTSLRAA